MHDDISAQRRPSWELRLLGGFELRADTATIALAGREVRLLAFLALHPPGVNRELAAGNLWDSANSRKAAASLRTAVWCVGKSAPGLIVTGRDRLALSRRVSVDVYRARRAAEWLTARPDPAVPPHAVALLEHELLPGWYDDWVIVEHERFRQLRVHALEAAARSLSANGRHAQAVDAARLAVVAEPLRESAHRAVIEAHLAEGNPGEAWRQYEECRHMFAEELGLQPSAALTRLLASRHQAQSARPAMTEP